MKAKAALAAVRGERTTSELASQFGGPSQHHRQPGPVADCAER